jgi:hypothetical protein
VLPQRGAAVIGGEAGRQDQADASTWPASCKARSGTADSGSCALSRLCVHPSRG